MPLPPGVTLPGRYAILSERSDWREILASALDWEEAHVNLDRATDNLPADLRGRRPDGVARSIWEQLEHLRLALDDLVDFCFNPEYAHERNWPDDYWPTSPDPPSETAWEDSRAAIRRDLDRLKRWIVETDVDLTHKIPRGSGQTYLRTVIVTVDHAAYHLGQIVLTRKLLGAWE
jgi:hypothetical protein